MALTTTRLARSARGNVPVQTFASHIKGVHKLSGNYARAGLHFADPHLASLASEIEIAALLHDCGKLSSDNQQILSGKVTSRHLIKHEDAGALWAAEIGCKLAQQWVYSHHKGLQSRTEELSKRFSLPKCSPYRFPEMMGISEQNLADFKAAYSEEGIDVPLSETHELPDRGSGFAHRFGLSCLVDADHTDSAYWTGAPRKQATPCRWEERLKNLQAYVSALGTSGGRDALRQALFSECLSAVTADALIACNAPVGSGKTLATAAYGLKTAINLGLRHIFVIAPYTNIIAQTVDVLRQALVLPGEAPERAIAEIHHQVEFSEDEYRAFSVLWEAPVIVTTAVQFFETLAAASTRALRKLHQLPGSAVIVDEAHASTPAHLFDQNLKWMEELRERWGCRFVLGSGSLVRFWEAAPEVKVHALASPELQEKLIQAEARRVNLIRVAEPVGLDGLLERIDKLRGPRLVILNTVQNAAVVANELKARKPGKVAHLSTALTPADRSDIIDEVKDRLNQADHDWALVATSCVEAGVDLSFRSAIREACSVNSLIQTSGRVNRHNEHQEGVVESVVLRDDLFSEHPGFVGSRFVLAQMWAEGWLERMQAAVSGSSPSDVATEAFRREALLHDTRTASRKLQEWEKGEEFAAVAENYKVIDTDTRTVIISSDLADKLERGDFVSQRELMMNSVQMWESSVVKYVRKELVSPIADSGIYRWLGAYDRFLGYMVGLVK